jgi:hypothetical protein
MAGRGGTAYSDANALRIARLFPPSYPWSSFASCFPNRTEDDHPALALNRRTPTAPR